MITKFKTPAEGAVASPTNQSSSSGSGLGWVIGIGLVALVCIVGYNVLVKTPEEAQEQN